LVALDVHRNSITVAAVDAQQAIVLRPQRVGVTEFEG
jgi:hypothetical protein